MYHTYYKQLGFGLMFDFLSGKFGSIFTRFSKNSKFTPENIEETLKSIEDALLEADVPYGLVQNFIGSIKEEVVGQEVIKSVKPSEQLLKIVHSKLVAFLGGKENVKISFSGVVMVLGLQGSGKTTSIAKLAFQSKNTSKKVLLASVDFYRPAAVDQLEIMAQKAGVGFYRATSPHPVVAAQEVYKHFKDQGYDVLFLDTAGRMHVDSAMLEELRAIDAHICPNSKLLVLDAMTGQESLNVAQAFEGAIGFDMALLAKMDSDTRGGAAFSFRYALKKPVAFIGTGEKIDALEPFYPERIAGRMLDMGDLQTLLEAADAKIKKKESDDVLNALAKGRFTLEDFAKQMDMMGRLGSMGQILKYMPGMGAAHIKPEEIERGTQEMKRFRVILGSMTKKERLNPHLLNGSRKMRIAKGAGVDINQVNLLLTRFEHVQQYAKLLKRMGPFKGLFK